MGEAYVSASRLIEQGHYRQALEVFRRAESLVPGFGETQWRLAELPQALGEVEDARARLTRYLELEADAERLAIATAELRALDDTAATYDRNVERGAATLLALLRAVFLDPEFGANRFERRTNHLRRQLEAAFEPLSEAVGLVAFGLRANALIAILYLEGGNYRAAREAYAAASDGGQPVSFYSTFWCENDDTKRTGKVEISDGSLRLITLSVEDEKAHRWVASVASGAGNAPDRLANVWGRFRADQEIPPEELLSVDRGAIAGIETKNDSVALSLEGDVLYLRPAYMGSVVPRSGPGARLYANQYVKLLRDFLLSDHVTLGDEGLTGGEKFWQAFRIGASAFSGFLPMAPFLRGALLHRRLATDRNFWQPVSIARRTIPGLERVERSVLRFKGYSEVGADHDGSSLRTNTVLVAFKTGSSKLTADRPTRVAVRGAVSVVQSTEEPAALERGTIDHRRLLLSKRFKFVPVKPAYPEFETKLLR